MGCDIHMYAEVKKNGKWEAQGAIFKSPFFRPQNPEEGYNRRFISSPWDGRNYDLFAILADVRNGRGFAGSYTGEGFNPIAEEKGLPEDVSDKVKAASDEWNGDGHSHSWLTLAELTSYDWDQKTKYANGEECSYRDAAGKWWFDETLPALSKLGDPENVRIVFWFDN